MQTNIAVLTKENEWNYGVSALQKKRKETKDNEILSAGKISHFNNDLCSVQ